MLDYTCCRPTVEFEQFWARSYASAHILPFILDCFYRRYNEDVEDKGHLFYFIYMPSMLEILTAVINPAERNHIT
jgi:hypothetical protein